MIKKYVSHVINALENIEKASTIEIDDEKKYYFSKKFSVFENDISPARTIEEKIQNVHRINELINTMKERVEDIELAVEAALCYASCEGGDEE